MPTATYAGHDVPVNDEGFLTDPAQWTEEMAPQIARSEGIAGLYGCQASCDLFGISKDDLIEHVQGIITVGEFYAMAAGGQIIFT
jgi:peroxiredoxin family protein